MVWQHFFDSYWFWREKNAKDILFGWENRNVIILSIFRYFQWLFKCHGFWLLKYQLFWSFHCIFYCPAICLFFWASIFYFTYVFLRSYFIRIWFTVFSPSRSNKKCFMTGAKSELETKQIPSLYVICLPYFIHSFTYKHTYIWNISYQTKGLVLKDSHWSSDSIIELNIM